MCEDREPSSSSIESESSDHRSADSLDCTLSSTEDTSSCTPVIIKSGYCVKQGARVSVDF